MPGLPSSLGGLGYGANQPGLGQKGTATGVAPGSTVERGCPPGYKKAPIDPKTGAPPPGAIFDGHGGWCVPETPSAASTAPVAPAAGAPMPAPSSTPPVDEIGAAAGLSAANQPQSGATMLYAPLGIRQGIGQRNFPPLERILNGLRAY